MAGDGPKARELVAQSGALRTLVGLGDRRVAEMAAARADAVDAAPSGSLARGLREDVAPGLQVTNESDFIVNLRKRKADLELAEVETSIDACNVRRPECRAKLAAEAKYLEAEAAKEAAQHALEEARRLRRLADEANLAPRRAPSSGTQDQALHRHLCP